MTSAARVLSARPTSEARSGSPVDLAHLGRYTLGNTELQREVLNLFVDQALATMTALQTAATAKAWREAAHTIKGAALAVGAWEVAAAGQQAEVADFNGGTRGPILANLELAIDEARGYIARI